MNLNMDINQKETVRNASVDIREKKVIKQIKQTYVIV